MSYTKSDMDENKPVIAVIGLGKLGVPFMGCWANRGFRVIGADINREVVDKLNAGALQVVEPGVTEMLKKARGLISATTSIKEAVSRAEVVFVFVGTPDEGEGKFTTKYVLSACQEIGRAIIETEDKKLIVLVSSVTAGSIEEEIIPALEAAADSQLGEGFDFCYSPVFIALGTMVRDYYAPDLALIGRASKQVGIRLWEILKKFYSESEKVKLVETNFVNAEMIKLVLSTFITTKISYANMLAELSQKIPGANADVVAQAIGLDARVSPKVLRGGMPYGGPCFPRDNRALSYLLRRWQVDGRLVEATDGYNTALKQRLAEWVSEQVLTENDRVAVLGLTFKPETNVIEDSAAIEVVKSLLEKGLKVTVYDPEGLSAAVKVFNHRVGYATSVAEAVSEAEVIFLATPWREITDYLNKEFRTKRPVTLIDMWRAVDSSQLDEVVKYIPFGRYYREQVVAEQVT
jgi:UDPglucose 6-dehydrogenase